MIPIIDFHDNNIVHKMYKAYSTYGFAVFTNCYNQWLPEFDDWKQLDDLKVIQDTDGYQRILKFINRKKSVSKKDILEHLGWGVRVGWSSYRNRLRAESTIKFTKNRYEVIKK